MPASLWSWGECARAWPLWPALGRRLDLAARSTHFDQLWRFDWPRTTSFDRLGRLDAARTTHFDRLCIDFAVDFHRFSREDRATYSTCSAMCQTFVFAGRCGTSEGWHARRQRRKATRFDETSPQRWFANERCVRTLAFVAPRHDLAPISVTSARPWTLLGAPRAQARPILGAWTDPDRPTSIDLGVWRNPKRPTLLDFGASTGPARWPERPAKALSICSA